MIIKDSNFHNTKNYRPEIDGLRAFAVITVIINHFNKDILPGGYLGVDIFFVISGFVITSSLCQRPSQNFKDFISGFYERRIKRLVPALSIFVLITTIIICLFDPSPNISLKTGLTSLFGLSNLYLLNESTDYFASSTELNVFTHTWSLGVEEQFYLIFPFLFWFSGYGRKSKNGTRNFSIIITILTIASLIGFLSLYPINEPVAYFSMPTRFWEIATGCLLFNFLRESSFIEKLLGKFSSLFIIFLLIGIMYFPISWAKINTILIVICSSILIICTKKNKKAYKILAHPAVVFIGLISYSLYLWHWGIISISRWSIGINWWTVPIQIIVILFLSIASYKFIETPFRKNILLNTRVKIFSAGGVIIFALSSFIFALINPLRGKLYSGSKISSLNNITDPLEYEGNFTGRLAKKCHSSDKAKNDALNASNKIDGEFIKNCLSIKSKKPLVAFSGDSHSLSVFALSEKIASTYKYDVFSHSREGCAFPPQSETIRKNCFEVQSSFSNEVINEFKNREHGSVIVAVSHLNSHFGYEGKHRTQIKKYNDGSRKSVKKNLKNYALSARKLALKLNESNASLIIFAPLVNHPEFTSATCSEQWFRQSIRKGCYQTSKDYLQKQRHHIMKEIKLLDMEVSNIYVFDPFEEYCDKKYCYVQRNGEFLYVDDNHLSEKGALVMFDSFMSLLNKIKSDS